MNITLYIISILFIYIACGCSVRDRLRIKRNGLKKSVLNELINIIIPIITLVLPILSTIKLFGVAWYWCILLNVIGIVIFISPLSKVYIKFFGKMSNGIYDRIEDRVFKYNLYLFDAVITCLIGIILTVINIMI